MERECAYHPGVEAKYWCAKHEKYLCEECMKCQDPGGYCKFRTSCMIWEMVKHGLSDNEPASSSDSSSKEIHVGGQS